MTRNDAFVAGLRILYARAALGVTRKCRGEAINRQQTEKPGYLSRGGSVITRQKQNAVTAQTEPTETIMMVQPAGVMGGNLRVLIRSLRRIEPYEAALAFPAASSNLHKQQ